MLSVRLRNPLEMDKSGAETKRSLTACFATSLKFPFFPWELGMNYYRKYFLTLNTITTRQNKLKGTKYNSFLQILSANQVPANFNRPTPGIIGPFPPKCILHVQQWNISVPKKDSLIPSGT
jgi:hypothetical protein